jgi:N-acyl-D-amino-acid deacylase
MRITAPVLVFLALAPSLRADGAAEPAKAAVEKGLRRIEQGVANYPKHRQCFSCHHQAMAVLSMTSARERGFKVDEELLTKVVDLGLRTFRNKALIARGHGVGGDSVSVVYALHTFAAVERPYDDTTAALVEYLLVKQRKDGAWPVPLSGDRPPSMGSLFTQTGLAMDALKKYGPPEDAAGAADLQERIDSARDKGRAWLLDNKPTTTEDKVFRLRGLVYAAADKKDVEEARDLLRREQREDGSWPQLADAEGDAYATGTVLTALCAAGLATTDAAYQKGVDYLVKKQNEDGSWVVQTRSKPLQVFFDNGDPGGKSQFISFAATGWAVMSLLELYPRR